MKTILSLLMLALCASAQARIGETVAECVRRYGKPTTVDDTGLTFTFESNGLHVYITFAGGKCVMIEYVRWKPWVFGRLAAETLAEAEQKLLLEANGGGQKWVFTGLFQHYDQKTENGSLYASQGSRFKIITKEAKAVEEKKTADGLAAKETAKKEEAKKKLQGF